VIALATIASRRGYIEFQTSFKHSDLELSDFITVQTNNGSSYTVRITSIDKGRPGIVRITAVIDSPVIYNYESGALASEELDTLLSQDIAKPIVVEGLPFNKEDDGIGYWVGAYSYNFDTAFAAILNIVDKNKQLLTQGKAITNTSTVATTTTVLPSVISPGVFDYTADITFKPRGSKIFPDSTESAVLADPYVNTYWYGSGDNWELIKIVNFTDNLDGTYTGSGILRGYKGTAHLSVHKEGDLLVHAGIGALKRMLLNTTDVGKRVNLILGNDAGIDPISVSRTVVYGSRLPLPPINVTGYKDADGAFYIQWLRQARYGVEWVNGYDVQLDEDLEEYEVYILDPGTLEVLQVLTVTQDTELLYNEANQIATLGGPVANLTIAVAQKSNELGRAGYISEVTVL
jgi:hypothetical protein